MKRKPPTALSPGYGRLLADIKARVHTAQIRAHLAANCELLVLYWDIGRMILDRQKAEGWGTKVIDRLSRDLQNEFPGQQGFSPRNLKYMRAFAEAWPETLIVQQLGAQLSASNPTQSTVVQAPLARMAPSVSPVVQQPVAQLSWYHRRVSAQGTSSIGSQREGNRERACPRRRAAPATEAQEIMSHSVKPLLL
jgi:hypothetical protein